MNNLTLKGLTNVDGMQFHHIEGGFGKGKRSMLAKEIANIHNKELKHINEAINSNKKRFKDYVDVIDLKGTEFEVDLVDRVFSKQSIANSRNIYLLSERGYSKLLKILEDDFAWVQYEKLVDGYFNMRRAIKENDIPIIKQKEIEARLKNARVREANILLKIADKPEVPSEYRQVLYSHASQIIAGQPLLPLPDTEKTYTAGDIGGELGISANKVGRIANQYHLKTAEYGKLVWDKSPHSAKQVQAWRYNEAGKQRLKEIFMKECNTK